MSLIRIDHAQKNHPTMSALPLSALVPSAADVSFHFEENSCMTAIGPEVFLHHSFDKTELSLEQYDPCLNLKQLTSSIPKNRWPTSFDVGVFTVWKIETFMFSLVPNSSHIKDFSKYSKILYTNFSDKMALQTVQTQIRLLPNILTDLFEYTE